MMRGNRQRGNQQMDCEKAFHRMYRYLDGEITVWRRWKITRHLNRCPPCAQGYDFEMELRQVVASRCRDQVPPALKARSAEAIGIEWNEQLR
jgi:mycothiol system anti-sigma-R factor